MRLLIVQPYLTKYRADLFNEIAQDIQEINILSSKDPNFKYGLKSKNKFKIFYFKRVSFFFFSIQIGIEKKILSLKPDKILIAGDFTSLSYWSILLLSKIKSIPVYVHGQGLYKKNNINYLHKFLFLITLLICKKYICYNQFVKTDLLRFNIKSKKIYYLNNTIINYDKSKPTKTKSSNEIVFIGRLRNKSNIGFLLEALKNLKNNYNLNLQLKIIGDGYEKEDLIKFSELNKLNVKFYGEIYDLKKIKKICEKSQFGIYPGDAGLSIVHFMSLSIIPIIHNNFQKHLGPEPAYINTKNGIFFKRKNLSSLTNVLLKLSQMDSKSIYKLAENSYQTYLNLNKVKMSDKLIKILK